ncbi:MAG TPA: ATP-binding protein [Candidatus Limnocylindria bacterium]|jgi:two-component system OmpR family sensor kinase/two-component system sensor histidine kinase BaeS
MAMFFVFAAVLSVVGATVIFWTLATALGASDLVGNIARGVALLIVVFGFLFAARSLRRLAAPTGDVIEAVGRVADGDLSIRVRERGAREARALARAFNAMTSRLEAGEEQRRRLLADVSHELRTPLSVVQGNLEALVDGVHPADEAHLVAILDETKVLSRLVEDLRTLSLAESGALTLHREAIDVGVLVREMVDSFGSQAEPAGVKIDAQVPSGLPQVDADPVRAREILTNLIANALRYTPRGGRVSVEARATDASVAIEVRDTGAGIAPDHIGRIFDRFYKSAESRGAGLGLAIAKQLVEAHGGEISATSVPGEGTDIRFTLPVESPVP